MSRSGHSRMWSAKASNRSRARKSRGAKDMLTMRAIMATEHVIVLYSIRKKGLTDPRHQHDDHDTVSTLVSGHLRVHVGDQAFDALPGSTWRHRPGVKHYSDTLEGQRRAGNQDAPREDLVSVSARSSRDGLAAREAAWS